MLADTLTPLIRSTGATTLDPTPRRADPTQLTPLHTLDIPTTLRAHAWDILRHTHGPAQHWWTIGTHTSHGRHARPQTIAARWIHTYNSHGTMQYATHTPQED